MHYNTSRSQYILTKLSHNTGQQRNTQSNKIRELRKLSCTALQNHDHTEHQYQSNDDQKQLTNIKYFKIP